MIMLNLLVAHMLGDFVFQPTMLIRKKREGVLGNLLHVSIIGAFMALAIFPYWNAAMAWAAWLVIVSTHFLQDYLKIRIERRYPWVKKNAKAFFVDQILHILVLILMALKLQSMSPRPIPGFLIDLYFSPNVSLLLVFAIFTTYTWDIIKFQFTEKTVFRPDHRIMLLRLIIMITVFLMLLVPLREF